MVRNKSKNSVDKFQAAVDYLLEYNGVRGAAIADSEGLIINGKGLDGFDAETFGAMAPELIVSVDRVLPRLFAPGAEILVIKTAGDWVTVAKSHQFYLIVAADREADDLLNIRISRALEMISSHLKNKYRWVLSASPAAVNSKNTEAVHV